jgi:hypothetical protein
LSSEVQELASPIAKQRGGLLLDILSTRRKQGFAERINGLNAGV